MKQRTENKMGKRILAGICCIGLLTAAGCSQNQEEPDPQELYQAAVEKNGELTDLEALLSKSELLADFKAVQSGNVWCTTQNVFQETSGLADMIMDMHEIFTDDTGSLNKTTYLYRLT